ncbi:exported hypothetical protein [Clostridium neonatale]|nr:exported hypothetical protein [Clostridium neonatale]CAI3721927.1 exported hypothetical protein [Clostridium neonatale]
MKKKIKNISISLVATSIAINAHVVKAAVASEINPENIVNNDQKYEVNEMLEKNVDIMNTERVTTNDAVEVDNSIISKSDLEQKVGRASDSTAPVLNEIEIDKVRVTTGEQILITAQANDDISGIKSISIAFKAPSGSALKHAYLNKDSDGKYRGKLDIEDYYAEGIWKAQIIKLEDNAGNSYSVLNNELFSSSGFENNILMDLSHMDFEVYGTLADNTDPVLTNIEIDKTRAKKGEEILIIAEASDDISGINNITVFLDSPNDNVTKFVYLKKDSYGNFTGTFKPDRYDAEGIWKVSMIDLEDNAGNSYYVLNSKKFSHPGDEKNVITDLSHLDFNIIDIGDDTTFPTLESIKLDKNIAYENEEINITLKANDDISGIKKINIVYASPNGDESKKIRLYADEDTEGIYTGTIEIDRYDEKGRWKISYIELTDNDLNYGKILNSNLFTSTNENNEILEDLSNFDFNIVKKMGEILYTEISISGQTYVGKTLNVKMMNMDQEVLINDDDILFRWFKVDSKDNEEFIGEGKEYKLTNDDKNHYILLKALYNGRIKERVITEDIVKQSSESNNTSSSSSSSSSSKKKENKNEQVLENIDSNTNNDSIASQIITNSDGSKKIILPDGTVAIGWNKVNEKWYLSKANGVVQKGWVKNNNRWYYLNDNGEMQTGWIKGKDYKWYYCGADGAMKTGWLKDIDGAWYHLNNSGVMSTGWIKDVNGKWYYLNSSGKMHIGWINLVINGITYILMEVWRKIQLLMDI